MGHGLQIFDENKNVILDSSHSITQLIRTVRVTTSYEREAPSIVTQSSFFNTNKGFYVCGLEQGTYITAGRATYRDSYDIIEEQTSSSYTVTFPPLRKGCDFTLYIGVY